VIVETQGLTKYFGDILALDSVDLKCEEGVTAILGPNGSGKTTLIRILLGLVYPSCGSARVFGFECTDRPEIRRRVGVLHEKPLFPLNFTAKDLLQMVCRFYGVDDGEERVEQALQMVELTGEGDRRIGTFSAGMIQRLGIAQALIHSPRLAILDEPTSNLDPLSRIRILNIIRRIWSNRGTSFLLLSHDLYHMEQVCTHAVFIKEGRILLSGALEDLTERVDQFHVTVVFDERQSGAAYKAVREMDSVINVERRRGEIRCIISRPEDFETELFVFALENNLFIKSLQIHQERLEQLYSRIMDDARGDEDEGTVYNLG